MARDPNQRSLATNAQIALDDLSIYFGIGTSGIFGQVEAPDIVSKEILGGILSPQTSLLLRVLSWKRLKTTAC